MAHTTVNPKMAKKAIEDARTLSKGTMRVDIVVTAKAEPVFKAAMKGMKGVKQLKIKLEE
jgi:hypothetical protein